RLRARVYPGPPGTGGTSSRSGIQLAAALMGHITYNSEGEIPMRFMLIAKATKESEAGLPPDPKLIAAIGKLSEDMAKAGVLVDVGGLLPTAAGAPGHVTGRNTARTY